MSTKVQKRKQKHMKAAKIRRALVAVMLSLLLSGCSPIGIEVLESGEANVSVEIDGEEAKEKIKDGAEAAAEKAREGAQVASEKAKEGAEWAADEGRQLEDAATSGIAKAWLLACLYLRGWAPLIIVGSLLVGYALSEVFPKNAEIRKFALVTMCVRIPVVTLIVTYATLLSYKGIAGGKASYAEAAAKTALPCAAWYEIAAPLGWVAAIGCFICIGVGLFLSERYRTNQDVVKMARRYLVVRIPLIAFLVFILYPFLYVMLS